MQPSDSSDSNTEDFFLINLDAVISQEGKLPTYTIRAAKDLKYSNFLAPGAFFDKLSNVELLHLAATAGRVFEANPEELDSKEAQDLVLLACLLMTGEGITDFNAEDVNKATQHLMVYSALESAKSNGYPVKLYRNNYSMSEEKGIIAEKITKGS